MGLSDLAGQAMERIVSRLCRRVVGWLLVVVFVLAAIYQGSVAASVALELEVGPVRAHLILAAFYVVAAFAAVLSLWATSRRPPALNHHAAALKAQTDLQLSTIIEAVLLGYSLSRRK
jgi:hypothetical protein